MSMINDMEDCAELWNTCLLEIEPQVTKANFSTWFKNTAITKIEDGVVFVGVPNEFVKEWMLTKYQRLILKSIVNQINYARAVEFIINRVTPLAIDKELVERHGELPI